MFGDALHHGVGLGVYGGGVEWVVAVHDAQESGGLFEGLGAEAGDLEQRLAVFEDAVLVAVFNDVLRQGGVQTGDVGEQRGGGGVDVDTDGVDTILDHGGE